MVGGTVGLIWSLISIPQMTERKGSAVAGFPDLREAVPTETNSRKLPAPWRPEGSAEERHEAWVVEADALPNEAVVMYRDVAQLAKIRELGGRLGFSITAQVDELGYARLRGEDRAFSALASRGYEIEGNYEVRLPPISEDELAHPFDHELVGFESGVLQFLGAPEDNSDWGKGVHVAVLDTGVANHPALAGARIRSTDLVVPMEVGGKATGYAGAVVSQSIEHPDPTRAGIDENGHGTAVVYQLVARDGYDTGMVPEASVMSLRILDGDGRGDTFTLAKGIVTAVQEGARVINLSLGTPHDLPALRRAIDYAESRGVVIVAAAGNDGTANVAYPASYPEVVSVAAVDARDRRAPFSNYGKVDVSAPGFGLPSAWLNDSYVYLDGTSGATPLVTGAIVRLLSRDPTLTPQSVRDILAGTSNDLGRPGHDPFYGAGRIDVARMERRGTFGIYDLAVTDFVFSGDTASASSIGLVIGVQNRGTALVRGGWLQIHFGGELVMEERVNLRINQVEAVQLLVDMDLLRQAEGLVIEAKVVLPEGLDDARPSDNVRQEHVFVQSQGSQ